MRGFRLAVKAELEGELELELIWIWGIYFYFKIKNDKAVFTSLWTYSFKFHNLENRDTNSLKFHWSFMKFRKDEGS